VPRSSFELLDLVVLTNHSILEEALRRGAVVTRHSLFMNHRIPQHFPWPDAAPQIRVFNFFCLISPVSIRSKNSEEFFSSSGFEGYQTREGEGRQKPTFDIQMDPSELEIDNINIP
jgi:hypothetical protein